MRGTKICETWRNETCTGEVSGHVDGMNGRIIQKGMMEVMAMVKVHGYGIN